MSKPANRRSRRRTRSTRQPKPPFPVQHQAKPGHEHRLHPRPAYEAPSYRAAGKLEGRVAIVTGGDSGIGRAVATLFAREGADVAIVCLPAERDDAAETVNRITALGRRALLFQGDLRRAAFCRKVVEDTVRAWGHLDVLVNNAAFQQHQASLEDVPPDQVARTFQTNVFAMFDVTRQALAHMTAGGVIINTGSITGLDGSPQLLDYSSTKGAIHAFTKSLAQSLVDRQIRVNCVAPGPVWTPLNPSDQSAREVAHFGSDTPMGRPAQPEEIAPAYVFFASGADSGYITGEVLTLLGGDTTAA